MPRLPRARDGAARGRLPRRGRAPPRSPAVSSSSTSRSTMTSRLPCGSCCRHFSRILPSCCCSTRVVGRRGVRVESTTSAITGCLRACASAALTAMRVAHVVNCASPRNWPRWRRSRATSAAGHPRPRRRRARSRAPRGTAAGCGGGRELRIVARATHDARDDRRVGIEMRARDRPCSLERLARAGVTARGRSSEDRRASVPSTRTSCTQRTARGPRRPARLRDRRAARAP